MDAWTVFKRVRRIVFIFLVIVGLIWATLLSVYLSRVFSHANALRRAIIIAMICVHGFSSLLLYLMAVVVFRMWLELVRMLFLLAIHIAPAVLFTLYGSGFYCATPFDGPTSCTLVRLVIFSVSWSITGILVVYTIYLCIMFCIPKPFPLLVPNELLGGSTSHSDPERPPSMSSVTSGSRLLTQQPVQPYNPPTGLPASQSIPSQSSVASRVEPKKSFVTNPDPRSVAADALTRSRRGQQTRGGASYGAVGTPLQPLPVGPMNTPSISGVPPVFSRSPVATLSPSAISPAAVNRSPYPTTTITPRQMEEGNVSRVPQRTPLLSTNPFMDVPSRTSSPESFYSQTSKRGAPANLNLDSPMTKVYGAYFEQSPPSTTSGSRVGIPPQLQPGAPSSVTSSNRVTPYMGSSQPSSVRYAKPPRSTADALTPSVSVRSLAPSVRLIQPNNAPPPPLPREPLPGTPRAYTRNAPQPPRQPLPGGAPRTYRPNPPQPPPGGAPRAYRPNAPGVPPPARMRAGRDGLFERPNSAGARMSRVGEKMMFGPVDLSNPYRADAQYPRGRSGSYSDGYGPSGYENYAGRGTYARQVQGLPMRQVQGPSMYVGGVGGRGGGAPRGPDWREMVMRAATG